MNVVVSELFDANSWRPVSSAEHKLPAQFDFEALTDVTYHHHVYGGIARIAISRPEVRNAFRPHTVDELLQVLEHARLDTSIGVVLLTGNGPSPKDGGWAFCSGGDQRVRGADGYQYDDGSDDGVSAAPAGSASSGGRLHILDVQRLIRFMPKVVIAVIPGWAAGGGHSLHVVCDLSIASSEHARFKQTDADVGSFDAGYGSAYFAKMVGQKNAREVFFRGAEYSAERAYEMGAVNAAVPHEQLEETAIDWAKEILGKSPTAIRMLKYAMNMVDDGLVGQQLFAGEATRLAYGGDEAREGRDAFLEKRRPDWSDTSWQV
ncbi:1,4-dihydroxy-2-naphthoyl-CoA synthase [Pontimonas salivibrio]|uniref:1,4-dihydroxy-2-naphthoyl-CoA synthase n=1 Tax=Pontimonas salivibrio TaxID=1159327 RepID=UPI002481A9CA|nr:1,4-dihydroxy-2-naphthoyl-CoA synthase [Pontimonas salivibrio]